MSKYLWGALCALATTNTPPSSYSLLYTGFHIWHVKSSAARYVHSTQPHSPSFIHHLRFLRSALLDLTYLQVDHIIDNLVAMKDGEMIHRIFSLLDTEGDLNDRLSGYFEKVRKRALIIVCVPNREYLIYWHPPFLPSFLPSSPNQVVFVLLKRKCLQVSSWPCVCPI